MGLGGSWVGEGKRKKSEGEDDETCLFFGVHVNGVRMVINGDFVCGRRRRRDRV